MKRLNTTSRLVVMALLIVVGAASIWAFNSRANARPVPVCHGFCAAVFSFGMVGITAEQTVRLSVVNTRVCPATRPCAPAQVELGFVKSNGTPVTNADGLPIHSSLTLASGESAFLDLNGSRLVQTYAGRAQIRGVVPSCIGCGDGKGTVLVTLEVFDNLTGKTTLVMPDYPAISSRGDDDDDHDK